MRKLLIADDSVLNRTILRKILGHEYEIIEASDGKEAVELIQNNYKTLSAVLLDIVMPAADGYFVLKTMRETAFFAHIPAIICAGSDDMETRENVYALGAAGFLAKPYNAELVVNTLHNIIRVCEMGSVKNTIMNDKLTGLLTGEAFFEKVSEFIAANKPSSFVLECIDIDDFKTVNNLYGIEGGNCLLRSIAEKISSMCGHIGGICGHIFADNFAYLYPNNTDAEEYVSMCRETMCNPGDLKVGITISAGRYVVTDVNMSPNLMYDYASVAKHSIKGKYDIHLAYFDDVMLERMRQSQFITGEMNNALISGQFEVWLQPQIMLKTGSLIGAEALVRWNHPEEGMLSPSVFIPIFEENGFVYELDKYIWEQVCILLHKWISDGKNPMPVSVNVSRYDIRKKDFIDVICSMVNKYSIPPRLLCVEITESAFANSTEQIVSVVNHLRNCGFTVEIDDFGSGYSSLNTLKDVPADIIKLDMCFLKDKQGSARSGNIIESVVRMIKWLGMSVLAEGVETPQQAEYLKTVGCSYGQGYLYAKPMNVADYENYMDKIGKEGIATALKTVDNLDNNDFWNPESIDTLIFNSYVGGACIIEYHNGKTETVRINDRFSQEFDGASIGGVPLYDINPEKCMDEANLAIMYKNIEKAIKTNKETTCEVVIRGLDNEQSSELYLRSTLRPIAWTNDRYLLYCVISNVTKQHIAEQQIGNGQKDCNTAQQIEELIKQSTRDSLTGALNRKTFECKVNDIIATTSTQMHALLMIDIDNFKNVNDVLGHIAGDNVLIRVAKGLHSMLRSDDLVGRIGGDEFMVFLQNIQNKEVIGRRAQMIVNMMDTVLDNGVHMSGSIGIAISPIDGKSFSRLYSCADKAAYKSKQSGKNRYTFFDEEYDDILSENEMSRRNTCSESSLKAWDERMQRIMVKNKQLIERQEEDERYRIVIHNTNITTFEWNAVTQKFTASPDFLHFVISEQDGSRLFSENVDITGIHPDDRTLFYNSFIEKVLSGEPAPETSLRLALKKGGYRWYRIGAIVFSDEEENLQKAIGVITPENVRKKQSDMYLEAVLKFAPAGIMMLEVTEKNLTALYVSESFFRLGNITEMQDGDVLKYVHKDDYGRLKKNILICSVSGAVMEETFSVIIGGKTYRHHMRAVRIPYAQSSNPVMIAVETDITKVKV